MPTCADRLTGNGDGWHWVPQVGDLVTVRWGEPFERELSTVNRAKMRTDLVDFAWNRDGAQVRLSTGQWVYFTEDYMRPCTVLKVTDA